VINNKALSSEENIKGGGIVTLDDSSSNLAEELIKSRDRVSSHGEVFTPMWLVENMLDLVRDESYRIDSRFLEPACGSGNFLVSLLQRKLTTVHEKYGKNDFEKCHYAILALMCIYGIELLEDNVFECRENLITIFNEFFGSKLTEDLHQAAIYVISQNVILGDALTMKKLNTIGQESSDALVFPEWGYLGKGKFQRRDFRFDALTQMSAFSELGTLFAERGRHEVFQPVKAYAPISISGLGKAKNETD
jgi:hypothetical protein